MKHLLSKELKNLEPLLINILFQTYKSAMLYQNSKTIQYLRDVNVNQCIPGCNDYTCIHVLYSILKYR